MTREDAKREMQFAKREVVADSWIYKAYDVAIKALSEPEIIQCKDCKWFGKAGCAINIVDDSDRPKETDFCSFAERRTDAADKC